MKSLQVLILLIFAATLTQCQTDDKDIARQTEIACPEYAGRDVDEIRNSDEGLFFAALYYLPVTEELFGEKSRWIGQQPDSFSELLSEEEKHGLRNGFLALLSNSDAAGQDRICRQVKRWGYIYQIFSHLGRIYSFEELVAAFWQTGKFNTHFESSLASRGLDTYMISPPDLAATLSSAEGIDIYLRIVTDITTMEQDRSLEVIMNTFELL